MADDPNPIQLQKFLSGVDYPADRDALVRHAKDNGADDAVLDRLAGMADRTYEGPSAVSEQFAK